MFGKSINYLNGLFLPRGMKKIHTRTKRKRNISSTHRHTAHFKGSARAKGAKTFSTQKAVLDYMKKNKLSEQDYKIEKVKKGRRFGIKKIL